MLTLSHNGKSITVISIYALLLINCFILISCTRESEKSIEESFLTHLYNINTVEPYLADEKTLVERYTFAKDMMTESAYNKAMANRTFGRPWKFSSEHECTLTVESISEIDPFYSDTKRFTVIIKVLPENEYHTFYTAIADIRLDQDGNICYFQTIDDFDIES